MLRHAAPRCASLHDAPVRVPVGAVAADADFIDPQI
jgi:hypothetical protein